MFLLISTTFHNLPFQRRNRKEERERRKLLALSHEISPNRETTTTFGSSGDFSSGGDFSGSNFDLREIRASDRDMITVSTAPRSRRKKPPEPSAPDEILIYDGEKASSRHSSPRSPRSLRMKGSHSDPALQDIEKSTWDQSNMADIRHIDSSLSTIHSELHQDESIGDILTKTEVTVIIEHVNDNDVVDLKQIEEESETATDNQNNNIENTPDLKVQDSDSDKESDIEQMDTKVTDSESETEKEDRATGGKDDKDDTEQQEYVVLKKRRKHKDEDEDTDKVVVVEKTIDDIEDNVSKSMSDIISENLSDYNEPRDFSSDGNDSRDSTVDQSDPPSKLREHKEVKMNLVLEGYYKYSEAIRQEGDGSQSGHSDTVHDSGINTPDLTNDIDPLSPTEKDFFFNKDGEFDDTFSEIFYDAENDFETSSRGPQASTDDILHDQIPLSSDTYTETRSTGHQTTLKLVTSEEDTVDESTENIFNEIKDSIESDRRLVATILDQRQYKEIIEVDIPYDLKFPHEKTLDTITMTTINEDIYGSSLSICNDCSLTRRKKTARSSPKRRSKDCSDIGYPVCAECKCTIVHYSYQSKPKPIDYIGYSLSNYCDLVFCDSALKAMEFNIDTLNKEGPGFIFVMTEALGDKQLPWSTEQRYKIASSRQPDRWILEFKSRNIEVDVVWQIRVQNHIKAVREVHSSLQQYNLHTNWFRCSLAVIIENVLNIASKYRVNKNSKHSTYS